MKSYPTIPTEIQTDIPVWVFDKIDGSNIRAEWNFKHGFCKFGSRKRLIDASHDSLGKSIKLIQGGEAILTKKFNDFGFKRVICYYEFFGPKSFAGRHVKDDAHEVALLDVEIHNQGYMSPEDYVKASQGVLNMPKLLWHGCLTEAIVEAVRAGTLPGMGFEGVVCKAPSTTGQGHNLTMFKIKNRAWIEKVRSTFGPDAERYI